METRQGRRVYNIPIPTPSKIKQTTTHNTEKPPHIITLSWGPQSGVLHQKKKKLRNKPVTGLEPVRARYMYMYVSLSNAPTIQPSSRDKKIDE